MYTAERVQIIRPRRVLDYFTLHLDNFRRPSVFHLARLPASFRNRNRAMTSVPGLLYASFWYDPFAHRIPIHYHRDGIRSGPAMMALGLVPTLLMLAGLVVATWRSVVTRGSARPRRRSWRWRSPERAMLVLHTWTAQSTASVKGTYLLQLAPVAGVFFAQGVMLLRGRVAHRGARAVARGGGARPRSCSRRACSSGARRRASRPGRRGGGGCPARTSRTALLR